MEPEHREDPHASNRPEPAPSELRGEQVTFTVPFASEGLERVRDSHC